MAVPKCQWGPYEFEVYSENSGWNDVPGVYIFAKRTGLMGNWTALYIGETGSFSKRLPGHEKWLAAVIRGATHIHVIQVRTAYERMTIEQTLVKQFQPPLNTEYR